MSQPPYHPLQLVNPTECLTLHGENPGCTTWLGALEARRVLLRMNPALNPIWEACTQLGAQGVTRVVAFNLDALQNAANPTGAAAQAWWHLAMVCELIAAIGAAHPSGTFTAPELEVFEHEPKLSETDIKFISNLPGIPLVDGLAEGWIGVPPYGQDTLLYSIRLPAADIETALKARPTGPVIMQIPSVMYANVSLDVPYWEVSTRQYLESYPNDDIFTIINLPGTLSSVKQGGQQAFAGLAMYVPKA